MNSTYGYDAASRLSTLSHIFPDGGADQRIDFGYNVAGQISARTSSNGLYDAPLTANVARDDAANGQNQLTRAGSTALGYDGRGNLTAEVERPTAMTPSTG